MSLSEQVAPHLPYLRRYARALTGDQTSGDAYVAATLEALIEAPESFPEDMEPRAGLYRIFHVIWTSSRNDRAEAAQASGQGLAALPPLSRQTLLLTALEGFTRSEAATILDTDDATVSQLLGEALDEIDSQSPADVLIIEDELIISMDLEDIVGGLGHNVTGVARTRDEAVAAANRHRPQLVLADIQLADGSSGIDAVTDILRSFTVPVIFITAYPDRLLTGERPEPTFLVTKPFRTETVQAAISQALFFERTSAAA
jgi:DNA-directed RNA polymerase specialized sigma24 family protein